MTASSKLKHTPPHPQDKTGGFGRKDGDPLFGFVPRMVTAKQVNTALVSDQRFSPLAIFGRYLCRSPKTIYLRLQDGDMNPFNKQPYSAQYKMMLKTRRKLPVFTKMTEFYSMASKHL